MVLGGGPGGYVAAIRAAQLGRRVVLVEKDRLGGVCLNRGCIPTKSMVKSAELFLSLRKARELGVVAEAVRLDFAGVMARSARASQNLLQGLTQLMAANGVEVLPGTGRVLPDGVVEVNLRAEEAPHPPPGEHGRVARASGSVVRLRPGRLILATGSEPARLPIPGTDLPGVMDSDGLLQLQALPESLVVIGGGIVGCEFASIFQAFGSRVSVLELLPNLLPVADGEVSRRLASSFRRAGIQVLTGVRVEAIEATGSAGPFGGLKRVRYTDSANRPGAAEGQVVLVSVGRRPCFSGFDPDELGIEVTRGGVKVDAFMQTTRPGVYAVGDLNGLSPLAHAASAQGLIAAEHACGQPGRPWGTSPVPSCVFSLPEVAWAGLTEEQAQASGVKVRVGRFSYGALGRAQVELESEGFVKILARAEPPDEGEVVGFHALGRGATELVHEGVLAMRFGATARELAEAIHGHPTFSEAVAEAAHALLGAPVHMIRR